MNKAELHRILQQLHDELARANEVDPESQALLEDLLTDISKLLGSTGDEEASEEHDGFAARLVELSREFEDHHPKLVTAIGRLADALSRIGV